jgi:SAM-dependent methyltransferase
MLNKIRSLLRPDALAEGQQAAEFYDRVFEDNPLQRGHYTASPYYFLWTVIVDRLRNSLRRGVLEVGCGAGQLAHTLDDAGIVERYCGFDFSAARVEHARRNCPRFRFEVADALETDLYRTVDYDAVIATEFLEHVSADLQVIESIRPGTYFLGTVPNFPYVSHVRHFADRSEVARRYAHQFERFRVDEFSANDRGKRFFLLEGIRAPQSGTK